MSVRRRKTPNKDGKRPWLAELPDPKRPGRTIRIGTYLTEAEAKDAAFHAEKERREGLLSTNKTTMTVTDLCNHYIAHLRVRLEAGSYAEGSFTKSRGYLDQSRHSHHWACEAETSQQAGHTKVAL